MIRTFSSAGSHVVGTGVATGVGAALLGDPMDHDETDLAGLSEETRSNFLGDDLQAVFTRVGQPVVRGDGRG